MQAESLEVLEKADLPPGQALAIVRAIEIELAGVRDTLPTNHDTLTLCREMADIRRELTAELRACASSITRHMYAALFGQTVMLLGIAYFFVTHVV